MWGGPGEEECEKGELNCCLVSLKIYRIFSIGGFVGLFRLAEWCVLLQPI